MPVVPAGELGPELLLQPGDGLIGQGLLGLKDHAGPRAGRERLAAAAEEFGVGVDGQGVGLERGEAVVRVERVRVLEVDDLVRAERLGRGPGRRHPVRLDVLLAVRDHPDPRRRDDPDFAGRPEPGVADALGSDVPEAVAGEFEVDDGEVPQLPGCEPGVRPVQEPGERVGVGQGLLVVLGRARVRVEDRPVAGGLLGDGVDGRVDPRAVVAELLGRVVLPPPGGRPGRGEQPGHPGRGGLRRGRPEGLHDVRQQAHGDLLRGKPEIRSSKSETIGKFEARSPDSGLVAGCYPAAGSESGGPGSDFVLRISCFPARAEAANAASPGSGSQNGSGGATFR